jgi:hypothetical protein
VAGLGRIGGGEARGTPAVPTDIVRGGGGWEGGEGVGNGGSVAVGSGMEEAPSAEAKGKRGSGKWARV